MCGNSRPDEKAFIMRVMEVLKKRIRYLKGENLSADESLKYTYNVICASYWRKFRSVSAWMKGSKQISRKRFMPTDDTRRILTPLFGRILRKIEIFP